MQALYIKWSLLQSDWFTNRVMETLLDKKEPEFYPGGESGVYSGYGQANIKAAGDTYLYDKNQYSMPVIKHAIPNLQK